MKIFSDNFRKYYKLLEILNEKGNPFRESAYFNFKDSYIYFSSNQGAGRFKFNFENDLNEEIPNFFIPIPKLVSIINQYDDVNLNSEFVFSSGKDKYKVNTIVDDDQIDVSIFDNDYEHQVTFNKEQLILISKALTFVDKDDSSSGFQAIFIEDKHICGMLSKTPMYEALFDCEEKMILPYFVSKMLLQVGNLNECSIHFNNDKKGFKIVSADGELDVVVPGSLDIEFPPTRSQQFIDGYTYDTKVKVDTALLSKTLGTLVPYFNDVVNTKIKFIFGEDISIKVEDKTTDVEKHIPYLEISDELKDMVYSISGSKVLQAINILKGKELTMSMPTEESKPIVDFYNDETEHILITRFKNEE